MSNVYSPVHYNSSLAHCSRCAYPIECIDVIEHMTANLSAATKYIWRNGLKGDAIEDLEKARWYLNREIELLRKKRGMHTVEDLG